MTASRLQAGTAFLLALGGLLAATTVLAIISGAMAVEAGIAVKPADRLLLDDLAAILPFILAFVVLDFVIAGGLAAGRSWAVASASMLAFGVVVSGVIGLSLIVFGSEPSRVSGNGLGIVGAFTAIYLFALIALRVDDAPTAPILPPLDGASSNGVARP